jgi:hypothetical protein
MPRLQQSPPRLAFDRRAPSNALLGDICPLCASLKYFDAKKSTPGGAPYHLDENTTFCPW